MTASGPDGAIRAGASPAVLVYHLALSGDWDPAAAQYRGSTLGRTLEEEGFVHCSTAEQLQATADRLYTGRNDVVLLTIDPRRLEVEVRVEEGFAHVYGPVPTAAVLAAEPVLLAADGRLRLAGLLGDSGKEVGGEL